MTRQQRVRPRYGRIAAATSSLSVTAIAVLGGTGALPSAASGTGAGFADGVVTTVVTTVRPDPQPPTRGVAGRPDRREPSDVDREVPAPPPGSGSGRRVVFSEGEQRVWLVNARERVLRSYLVSGSLTDNLDPGTYAVYSRSEQAWGIDDSGTMRYFVRFTQGENAAIGFHDIPVDDGEPVQTVDELGTPQSHGCIRQRRADAIALWEFAPVGTTVVVTA